MDCQYVGSFTHSVKLLSYPCGRDPRGTTFYHEQVHREVKRIHTSGCRWCERLKPQTDSSKILRYTGFHGDLEHLMIETRLIGESFECVMGECMI